jgi:hypothetical protein
VTPLAAFKENLMKTTVYVLLSTLVLVAVVAQLGSIAQAETCYQLKPFVDVLRVNVQVTDGTTHAQHALVYGDWVATTSYTMPIVGSLELNVNSTTVRRLGVHGTNDTSDFGSNPACVIDGIPGGAWTLTCFGGPGARFTNSGTDLALVACTPPIEFGPVAGSK